MTNSPQTFLTKNEGLPEAATAVTDPTIDEGGLTLVATASAAFIIDKGGLLLASIAAAVLATGKAGLLLEAAGAAVPTIDVDGLFSATAGSVVMTDEGGVLVADVAAPRPSVLKDGEKGLMLSAATATVLTNNDDGPPLEGGLRVALADVPALAIGEELPPAAAAGPVFTIDEE